MSNRTYTPSERFKQNLLVLFDIINEMYTEGQENGVIESKFNILSLVKIYIKRTSGDYMLKRFIKRTNEYWDKIHKKDLEYFKEMGLQLFSIVEDKGVDAFKDEEEMKESNQLISSLSGEHIKTFKLLLSSTYHIDGEEYEIFDNETQGDVWNIMHSFVKISLAYIHESREPYEVDENGKFKYKVSFFPAIKVKTEASNWGVKLKL